MFPCSVSTCRKFVCGTWELGQSLRPLLFSSPRKINQFNSIQMRNIHTQSTNLNNHFTKRKRLPFYFLSPLVSRLSKIVDAVSVVHSVEKNISDMNSPRIFYRQLSSSYVNREGVWKVHLSLRAPRYNATNAKKTGSAKTPSWPM